MCGWSRLANGPQVSEVQITRTNRLAVAYDQGVMNDVLKFSDITRPTVSIDQLRFCFRAQPDVGAEPLRIFAEKVVGAGGEVTAAFAKCRDPQRSHFKPKIDTFPQPTPRHPLPSPPTVRTAN